MDYLLNLIGGNLNQQQMDFVEYPADVQNFIKKSLDCIDYVYDNHAHLCGLDDGKELYINPIFESNMFRRFHMNVFKRASGINHDADEAEQSVLYVGRLQSLLEKINQIVRYKLVLLPMDYYYENGEISKEKTAIRCSDKYVYDIYSKNKELFMPAVSIHPERHDAINKLVEANCRGIKLVKWLPNSMNIDPSNKKYGDYYDTLVKLNMKLLVHIGEEHSVNCGHLNQQLGNPMLLEYPLRLGVKIIGAHCGSEGYSVVDGKKVENYKLLFHLMDKYDNLYTDISAMLAFKRAGKPLEDALDNVRLHHRFLYGSDYPVPCINAIISTKLLWWYGYITYHEHTMLNTIYINNPLLFNLITFRTLKSKNGNKFSDEIFKKSFEDL